MSRMDRHKKQKSTEQIFARKTIEKQTDWEEDWEDVESGNNLPPSSPPPKSSFFKKKPKKQKKHRFVRCLITFLIVCIGYSGISFFVGQQVAKSDSASVQPETFNGMTAADGSHNILLIGNDSREGETARADTIMVLQLDGPAKKPKLISFMRDTLVTIPGVGDNKINAAYAYGGAELVRTTLSQNFGIETSYYTTVDFQTFEKVIDTLFPSGVKIDAEKDMSKNLEVAIKQGPQKMDGLTLLQYARFRMDEEGDFGRVRRQQQVMNAVFSQVKNPISLLKLPYAVGKVMGYASTDLSMGFLLKNTLSIAKGAAGVDRLSVPVEGSWSYGETYEAGSVLVVDTEMNRQAIQQFLSK